MAAAVTVASAAVKAAHAFSMLRKDARMVAIRKAMILYDTDHVVFALQLQIRFLRSDHSKLLKASCRRRQLGDADASDSPW